MKCLPFAVPRHVDMHTGTGQPMRGSEGTDPEDPSTSSGDISTGSISRGRSHPHSSRGSSSSSKHNSRGSYVVEAHSTSASNPVAANTSHYGDGQQQQEVWPGPGPSSSAAAAAAAAVASLSAAESIARAAAAAAPVESAAVDREAAAAAVPSRKSEGDLGYCHAREWHVLWSKSTFALKAARKLGPGRVVSAVVGLNSLTMKKRMALTMQQVGCIMSHTAREHNTTLYVDLHHLSPEHATLASLVALFPFL